MNIQRIKEKSAEFGVPWRWAIIQRIQYLKLQRDEVEQWLEFWTDYPFNTEIDLAYCNKQMSNEIESFIKITKEIKHLEQAIKERDKTPEITDEMIERARQYPIESLIQFDRTGKATAWCHDDKRPSLSWFKKANSAFCFPCHKKFNPIDVLMVRDGQSFAEAVKSLQ